MPSSEKVVSPGVFTNEIDQTFLPAAVSEIGAAIVGPTVKGPALIPTIVTSYSDFQSKFGDVLLASGSTHTGNVQYLTSHAAREYLKHSNSLTVVRIMDGAYSHATALISSASFKNGNSGFDKPALKLHTLSHGSLQNTTTASRGYDAVGVISEGFNVISNAVLKSGSAHNLRWEVSNVNTKKGTFTLLIRAGNDTSKRKQILESWNNLSIDPSDNAFVGKVIGDQVWDIKDRGTTDPYLQLSGSYPNKSKFVRVEVLKSGDNYIDNNGNVNSTPVFHLGASAHISASLPAVNSGSFAGGADGFTGFNSIGKISGGNVKPNFYENINSADSQGYNLETADEGKTGYTNALDLLKNQDEYDINMILLPGICD